MGDTMLIAFGLIMFFVGFSMGLILMEVVEYIRKRNRVLDEIAFRNKIQKKEVESSRIPGESLIFERPNELDHVERDTTPEQEDEEERKKREGTRTFFG
mgnify:CR=1 FL=1